MRRKLASLPVAEKLRMLDDMRKRELAIREQPVLVQKRERRK
jgi:hypothetical protein